MMPQGSAGQDFHRPFAPSIPACHFDASPPGSRIGKALGQTGLPLPDYPRPPDHASPAPSCRSNRRASKRKRVIMQTRLRTAFNRSMAA